MAINYLETPLKAVSNQRNPWLLKSPSCTHMPKNAQGLPLGYGS